jgi:hypothetical protein
LYKAVGNERAVVKIKLTGKREWDDLLAFELSEIKETKEIKKLYTWHHLDDYDPFTGTCTMQLVEKGIHIDCSPHVGGANLFDSFFNFGYYNRNFNIK